MLPLTNRNRREMLADFTGQMLSVGSSLFNGPWGALLFNTLAYTGKWAILLAQSATDPLLQMRRKAMLDFQNSRIRSGWQARELRRSTIEKLREAGILRWPRVAGEGRALPSGCDYWDPSCQRQALTHLRRRHRHFTVSLASPSVSVALALQEMNRLLEYQAVELDFEYAYGRQQLEPVIAMRKEWDFLVLADAPLFFLSTPALNQYQFEFVVYAEPQYAIGRRSRQARTTLEGIRALDQILVLPETTLELQSRIYSWGRGAKLASFSDLFLESAFLEPGRAVLLWEPCASFLRMRHGLAKVPGTEMDSTISLYSHRRFSTAEASADADAFKAIFVQAWHRCLVSMPPVADLPVSYGQHFMESVRASS